jgi:hypothetical protein
MKLRWLVLITFVIGLGAGLAYAWLIDPVTYSESSPALVTRAYREGWLLMTAEAYAQNGDWARTRIRLDALHDTQLGQTVADLFDRYHAYGPNAAARALAQLADRLGTKTAGMLVYLSTPQVTPTRAPATIEPTHMASKLPPTSIPTSTATPEPLPTLPPTVTPVPDYRLIERVAECVPSGVVPQLRVFIQDELGNSVAGKEVWVTWDGGADRFFTGFKPEIDPGYGDFDMALDQTYNVGVDKPTSVLVSNLRAEPCGEAGHTSWRLVFGPVAR